MPFLSLQIAVGGVCGVVVATDLVCEVRSLSAGGVCHVASRDDVSSSSDGVLGAAANEKPLMLVCAASAASEPGKTTHSCTVGEKKQLSMRREA